MQPGKFKLIFLLIIAMAGIVIFVNYLGNSTSAYDKAPILHGKGRVEKVEFVPEHDQTITSGSRRRRTTTIHVADAYSIKVKINEENETGALLTYDLTEGSKWQTGDKVDVEYKKVKTFFFMPSKIFVVSIK